MKCFTRKAKSSKIKLMIAMLSKTSRRRPYYAKQQGACQNEQQQQGEENQKGKPVHPPGRLRSA